MGIGSEVGWEAVGSWVGFEDGGVCCSGLPATFGS